MAEIEKLNEIVTTSTSRFMTAFPNLRMKIHCREPSHGTLFAYCTVGMVRSTSCEWRRVKLAHEMGMRHHRAGEPTSEGAVFRSFYRNFFFPQRIITSLARAEMCISGHGSRRRYQWPPFLTDNTFLAVNTPSMRGFFVFSTLCRFCITGVTEFRNYVIVSPCL